MTVIRLIALVSVVASVLVLGATAAAQPAGPEAPAAQLTPPKLLSEPQVDYPAGARGDARVVLTLVVDRTGAVTAAIASDVNEPFSSAASAAALEFRFEPALRDGVPVAAKIRMELVFREPSPPPVDARAGDEEQQPEAEARPPSPIEVVVRGERAEPSRSASLSRAEVRQIPGTFGDPFRAIEALPGVTPIVSGLPFFFIRGAPPGNVGYFLDGVRVPLLFHVGIGPSVVHPGLIDRVDLYPGGYPARYGRFAGGIVAGETTEPTSRFKGEYNLRLFDAGAMVEVPFADGRGTALVGGRYSYTAFLLSLVSPGTLLEYWDYQSRVTYDLTREDRVGVFAFGSYDFLGQVTETSTLTLFGTEFHRVDLRYDRRLHGKGNLRTALTIGLDKSSVQQDRSVVSRLLGGRTELTQRLDEQVSMRAGTDIQFDTYSVELGTNDLSPEATRASALFPSRTDMAFGVRGDVVVTIDDRLEVTPGVRADLYASDGASAVGLDPRVAGRLTVSERVAVLSTFGVAHQPPAFVVPVPGFQPGGLRGGLQRALQQSLGLELDLGDDTMLTTTVFQNAFFNMTDPLGASEPELDGCAPGTFPAESLAGDYVVSRDNPPDCAARFEPGTLGPDRSGGGGQAASSRGGRRAVDLFEVRTLGSAYGLEVFLKRKLTRKLGGFVSYTLSRSTRSYQRRQYVAAFDRTHVLNVAAAYDLGRNWRAGGRVMFYTGLPTPPNPFEPDKTRLPPFFRADARLEKRWQLSDTAWISAIAEWMNATLNKEPVQTECTLAGCEAETIGPVTIPSIGLEGGF